MPKDWHQQPHRTCCTELKCHSKSAVPPKNGTNQVLSYTVLLVVFNAVTVTAVQLAQLFHPEFLHSWMFKFLNLETENQENQENFQPFNLKNLTTTLFFLITHHLWQKLTPKWIVMVISYIPGNICYGQSSMGSKT